MLSLTAPLEKTSRSQTLFWFCLSLTCAAVFGLMAMRLAFASQYVVQDDVRQHVFWMRRFLDPTLFSNDLIADYFQSVAPAGYTMVYRALAAIGIDPLIASKLIPFVLQLITTAYCFGACLQILPVPLAGFLASLLLNQNLIMADDLNSATPRAFLYPLFLAFLYYFMRRSLLPCLVTIALLGMFYPQVMLIAAGILVLSLIQWQPLRLSKVRREYVFCGAGLVVAVLAIVLYQLLGGSEFGPAIKAAQARQMAEFWQSGRGAFFNNDPIAFWIFAGRSGILPHPQQLLKPPLILTGLFLPLLLRLPARFTLVQQVTAQVRVLPLTVLSSVCLFFAAHALVFRLHHPSRYTQHSFRIVLALAAGVVLTILLDALLRWITRSSSSKRFAALGLAGVVAIVLVIYPATARFRERVPFGWLLPTYLLPGYTNPNAPADLYQFFAQQPKESVIASLAPTADNLPTFSRRSILVGREYGIPYHLGYYQQFRARTIDLIRAHYSPNLDEVRRFAQKYRINFWLLDRAAFTPEYLQSNPWIQQYQPAADNAAAALKQGTVPAVQQAINACTVFSNQETIVLKATCIAQSSKEGSN